MQRRRRPRPGRPEERAGERPRRGGHRPARAGRAARRRPPPPRGAGAGPGGAAPARLAPKGTVRSSGAGAEPGGRSGPTSTVSEGRPSRIVSTRQWTSHSVPLARSRSTVAPDGPTLDAPSSGTKRRSDSVTRPGAMTSASQSGSSAKASSAVCTSPSTRLPVIPPRSSSSRLLRRGRPSLRGGGRPSAASRRSLRDAPGTARDAGPSRQEQPAPVGAVPGRQAGIEVGPDERGRQLVEKRPRAGGPSDARHVQIGQESAEVECGLGEAHRVDVDEAGVAGGPSRTCPGVRSPCARTGASGHLSAAADPPWSTARARATPRRRCAATSGHTGSSRPRARAVATRSPARSRTRSPVARRPTAWTAAATRAAVPTASAPVHRRRTRSRSAGAAAAVRGSPGRGPGAARGRRRAARGHGCRSGGLPAGPAAPRPRRPARQDRRTPCRRAPDGGAHPLHRRPGRPVTEDAASLPWVVDDVDGAAADGPLSAGAGDDTAEHPPHEHGVDRAGQRGQPGIRRERPHSDGGSGARDVEEQDLFPGGRAEPHAVAQRAAAVRSIAHRSHLYGLDRRVRQHGFRPRPRLLPVQRGGDQR